MASQPFFLQAPLPPLCLQHHRRTEIQFSTCRQPIQKPSEALSCKSDEIQTEPGMQALTTSSDTHPFPSEGKILVSLCLAGLTHRFKGLLSAEPSLIPFLPVTLALLSAYGPPSWYPHPLTRLGVFLVLV